MVPTDQFFTDPELRQTMRGSDLLVYGPGHLLRAAWLAGARDYLREPWTAEELFVRLRGPLPAVVEWNWGPRPLWLDGQTLGGGPGAEVRLSSAEAELLRILALRQGTVVSRGTLGWAASCSQGRVVDTLISRLRIKIQAVSCRADDPVVAVRGLGYRLP